MDEGDIDAYLNTLSPMGQTYHDIGMIWGGRLLSPTGIFASENADVNNVKTNRHLIFLTDGQTEAYDVAHTSYGIDALDRRRWSPSSVNSLNQTVEKRFAFACDEVKKRNITVWVIAFGTHLNPVMTECAGPGHNFEASDSEELADIFSDIASSIGELRITK